MEGRGRRKEIAVVTRPTIFRLLLLLSRKATGRRRSIDWALSTRPTASRRLRLRIIILPTSPSSSSSSSETPPLNYSTAEDNITAKGKGKDDEGAWDFTVHKIASRAKRFFAAAPVVAWCCRCCSTSFNEILKVSKLLQLKIYLAPWICRLRYWFHLPTPQISNKSRILRKSGAGE